MKETMRVYLTLRFLSSVGMSVMGATYVVFLQSRGLNLFQVNLVNVVCWVTMFFFQVPTGLVADVFGRKLSFLISCVLLTIDGVIYGLSQTMTGFVISEILAALGMTFASGAFEAWVVARLKEHGYTGSQSLITSRSNLVGSLGTAVGGLIGGVLGSINLAIPWFAMSGVMTVTGLYALVAMKETIAVDAARGLARWLRLKSTFCASLRYLYRSKELHFILFVDAVVIFAVQPLNMYWQPFFKELWSTTQPLGVLKAVIALLFMFAAYLVMRFGTGENTKQSIVRLVALIGGLCLASGLITSHLVVLLPFLLHDFVRGLYEPIKSAYLQEHLPDAERATIASMISMILGLTGALGLFVSGLVAEHVSISASWCVSGLCFIFVALYYARKLKR